MVPVNKDGASQTQERPDSIIRSLLEALGGYAGLVASGVTIYLALHLDWLSSVSARSFGIVCLGLGGVIVAQAVLVASYRRGAPIADAETRSFHENLVETIREEFHRGNDREVIRVGEALSRPLFESGAFSVRLDIGRMVEEAAARSERRRVQYVALIDEIGWSLVELGRYAEATRQIQHGMRILESSPDVFYEAKAHRHLGVIARRERRYDEARDHYAQAEHLASGLEVSHDRLAMVAGLQYAQASLSYYQSDFSRAATEIDDAITSFTDLKDEYRLNMALVLRGDIEFRLGQHDVAADTYRGVLQGADRNKERLQYVRACLGLAEVRADDRQWDEAERVLGLVVDLDLLEYRAELQRLEELRSQMPRAR